MQCNIDDCLQLLLIFIFISIFNLKVKENFIFNLIFASNIIFMIYVVLKQWICDV